MKKTRYAKNMVLANILIDLLVNDRKMSTNEIMQRYEISRITVYKYISSIKNLLVEFNHYDYELQNKNGYYQLVKYP